MESLIEIETKKQELKKSGLTTKFKQKQYDQLGERYKRAYRLAKERIMDFEPKNRQYLVLLRSTNGFFKMFEYSALFYALDLAPKMSMTVTLQDDSDFVTKSRIGAVSLRDPEKLIAPLKKLNITQVHIKDESGNFIVFKLPWQYDNKQIDMLIDKSEERMRRFNQLVMVDNAIPVLFLRLGELHSALLDNVRKMPGPVEREGYGFILLTLATELQCFYLAFANGKIDVVEFFEATKKRLDGIKYRTKVIADLGIWKPKVIARIGDILIDIANILDSERKSRKIAKT